MFYQIYKIVDNTKKYGVIDTQGNNVIDTVYDKILIFSKHFALKSNEVYSIITHDSKEVFKCNYNSITEIKSGYLVEQNFVFGIINFFGEIQEDIIYDKIEETQDERTFIVSINEKCGLLKNNTFLLEPKFEKIISKKRGVYFVYKNQKAGIFDATMEILIEPSFDYISFFDLKGYAIASVNNNYGFVNTKGEWNVYPIYNNLTEYDDNDLSIVRSGVFYGIIDRKGKFIVKPIYNECNKKNENYFVRKGDEKYILDKNGETLSIVVDNLEEKEFDVNELYVTNKNGFFGLNHKNENTIVEPVYNYISHLTRNFYLFYDSNNLGIIDTTGKVVLNPIFSINDWSIYDNSLIRLMSNNVYYIFKFDNQELIKLDCESIGYFDEVGVAIAEGKYNYYGLINTKGEWIASPIYEDIGKRDVNGYYKAFIAGRFGWINEAGEWVIQPIFEFYDYTNFQVDGKKIFENENINSIIDRIKYLFSDDNDFEYIVDNIPESLKLELDLDFLHNLKHLLFVDDSYDLSCSSGILLSYKDERLFLILIEKWSDVVVINLNSKNQFENLVDISYDKENCTLFTHFNNDYKLKNKTRSIGFSDKIDDDFKPNSIYAHTFFNQNSMVKIVEVVKEIISI
jgi:hypothetical protein